MEVVDSGSVEVVEDIVNTTFLQYGFNDKLNTLIDDNTIEGSNRKINRKKLCMRDKSRNTCINSPS